MEQKSDLSLQELNQKAGACMQQGDLEGALTYISQLLDILDPAVVQIRAKTIANKGFILAGLKRFTEAKESFSEASGIFRENDDLVGMAIQIGNMGSIHRDQGEFNEALNYYHKALEILKEQDAKPAVADQYSNIAYAYSQRSDLQAAISNFQLAVDIYDDLGSTEKADQCRANMKIMQGNVS